MRLGRSGLSAAWVGPDVKLLSSGATDLWMVAADVTKHP